MDYSCWGLNLTPSPAFHPNGTMYIAFHCDLAMGDVVLVSAPSYRGPFTRVAVAGERVKVEQSIAKGGFGVKPHPEARLLFQISNCIQNTLHRPEDNTRTEAALGFLQDPFFWIAKNDGTISWHLVLHNNPRGVHLFSSDGLDWKLQQKLDAKGRRVSQPFSTKLTCAHDYRSLLSTPQFSLDRSCRSQLSRDCRLQLHRI
jgi:hypothetical protein